MRSQWWTWELTSGTCRWMARSQVMGLIGAVTDKTIKTIAGIHASAPRTPRQQKTWLNWQKLLHWAPIRTCLSKIYDKKGKRTPIMMQVVKYRRLMMVGQQVLDLNSKSWIISLTLLQLPQSKSKKVSNAKTVYSSAEVPSRRSWKRSEKSPTIQRNTITQSIIRTSRCSWWS